MLSVGNPRVDWFQKLSASISLMLLALTQVAINMPMQNRGAFLPALPTFQAQTLRPVGPGEQNFNLFAT